MATGAGISPGQGIQWLYPTRPEGGILHWVQSWSKRIPATNNMQIRGSSIVSVYLSREVRMWRCSQGTYPKGVHISPVGIIPKNNKLGKWWMMVDLSAPSGHSVNDSILLEVSLLSYLSVDHLSSLVASIGKRACLVKANIKEAYSNHSHSPPGSVPPLV